MSNEYQCDADDSLDMRQHARVCIVCAYTHYRTLLLAGVRLKCYDPACKRSHDLATSATIAVCALSASEYEEYSTGKAVLLAARAAASLAHAAAAAGQDPTEVLLYMARSARRCPACETRVAKVSGCNEVACQNCGAEFDWLTATNDIDVRELARRRVPLSSASSSSSSMAGGTERRMLTRLQAAAAAAASSQQQ
jgi:hypothetical protein